MKLIIDIDLDNDSFAKRPIDEISAVLDKWLTNLIRPAGTQTLIDSNGNTCGTAIFEE
jgi:hypothetical protein